MLALGLFGLLVAREEFGRPVPGVTTKLPYEREYLVTRPCHKSREASLLLSLLPGS